MNTISRRIRSFSRPTITIASSRISSDSSKGASQNLDKTTNTDGSQVVPKKYNPNEVTADDMRWRTPWHRKEGNYYSVLRQFYTEDNNTHVLKRMQAAFELTPSKIKKWFENREDMKQAIMQSYIPERNQILGNELAAAHFIVFRGGAVKFYNQDRWIKADKDNNYSLPKFYDEEWKLEAIDCTDMNLYHEGLVNLRELDDVKWLSLNGCERIDDWSLDTIGNIFSHSLVYLDIRNCPNITENGVGALYKMNNLKILYVDDFLRSTTYEMTCLLLQEIKPDLEIKSDKVVFEIESS